MRSDISILRLRRVKTALWFLVGLASVVGLVRFASGLGPSVGRVADQLQRGCAPGLAPVAVARRPELHLMVLDVHMPGCTGIDVVAQLVEEVGRDHLVPCIFYSGAATANLEQRALDLGGLAFLHKPVEPLELRAQVMRALAMGDYPESA